MSDPFKKDNFFSYIGNMISYTFELVNNREQVQSLFYIFIFYTIHCHNIQRRYLDGIKKEMEKYT